MLTTASGWIVDVERGPGWLFVTLGSPDPEDALAPDLADQLWSLAERHFIYRIVIRLDQVRTLDRTLLRELVRFYRRIRHHGGMMRLSSISSLHREMLGEHRLLDYIPAFDSVHDAVMGGGPKPR
jgi:anti-anti-sigma regulatory factor